jgi:hypothetical protein
MALSPNKEVNRLPGLAIERDGNGNGAPDVMAGQLVRFVGTGLITLANGSLSNASNSVLGVALDTTAVYTAVQTSTGNGFIVTDSYAKNGLVSVAVDGGNFTVWNDGRGAVFATDVIGAAAGALLYCNNSGQWTTIQGSASTAGVTALAMVTIAPTSSTDALTLQMLA